MALPASCPTCERMIAPNEESGRIVCPGCSEKIWFTQFGSDWVVATTRQLEDRFGFSSDDLSPDETIELLRDCREDSLQEPWHIWKSADYDSSDQSAPIFGDDNPYHPPGSAPRKTDPTSETFVFRAAATCDESTLQWATRNYGIQSDVAGLTFAGLFLAFVLLGFLLYDQIEYGASVVQPGFIGWIVAVVIFWFAMRRIPRIAMAPYVRRLDGRCEEEPLFAGDVFWITIRRSTMSAQTETMVMTWPLREVWSQHHDTHLIVLRVAPYRLLFVASTSLTMPEDFASFSKGVRRRLRRYWRSHFFRFEIS